MRKQTSRVTDPAKSPGNVSTGKMDRTPESPATGEVVLYRPRGGKVELDVRLDHDTVWLSLNQIAKLFGRDRSVISRHLDNILKSK
jgi:hypothetical protein